MIEKKRNPGFISPVSALCGLVWLVFFLMHIGAYAYRYPVLSGPENLLKWTIPTLILPLAAVIVSAIFSLLGKRWWCRICCILFLPLLAFSCLRSVSEILYAPAVCSATSDPGDFGVYDKAVEEFLRLNPPIGFPDAVPTDAENVRYRYFYCNSSAETIYIAVSWDTQDTSDASAVHTAAAAKTAVFWEPDQGCITYVLTNRAEYLPASASDVYTIDLE